MQYNCHITTIYRVLKREQIITIYFNENRCKTSKRKRPSRYPVLDKALSIWFKQMRGKKVHISGSILLEQADLLAKIMNIQNFKANHDCLGRWKKEENIKFRKLHGEKASANQSE